MIQRIFKFIWRLEARDWLFWVLMSCPVAVVALSIHAFAVNLPFRDEWSVLALINNLDRQGFIAILDKLWENFNEHRVVVPRIIIIVGAYITGWNALIFPWVNLAIGVFAFYFLIKLIASTRDKVSEHFYARFGAIVACSIFFSMSQQENWFWAWQSGVFVGFLCVFYSAFLLSNKVVTTETVIKIAICCFFATFGFASGASAWGASLLCIYACLDKNNTRQTVKFLSVFMSAALMCLFLYLYKNSCAYSCNHAFDFLSPLENTGMLLTFFISALSMPLGWFFYESQSVVMTLGIVGIGVFIISWHFIRRRLPKNIYIPFILLCLYGLFSTAIYSIGRLSGDYAPDSSRHMSLAIPFWIGCVGLISLIATNSSTFAANRYKQLNITIAVLLATMFILSAFSSMKGIHVRRLISIDQQYFYQHILTNYPSHLDNKFLHAIMHTNPRWRDHVMSSDMSKYREIGKIVHKTERHDTDLAVTWPKDEKELEQSANNMRWLLSNLYARRWSLFSNYDKPSFQIQRNRNYRRNAD